LNHVESGAKINFYLPEKFFMIAYSSFSFRVFLFSVLATLIPAAASYAHHSFAAFDIRNSIEINGVTEDFVFRRPHPKLTLLDDENVTWEIEVPIRFWERAGLPQDAIKPGDEIMVRGFPARSGAPKLAMSGFEKDGTYHSIHEEVGQRSGNEAADAIESGESVEDVLERYAEPESEPE
jgi:hypothetical protein